MSKFHQQFVFKKTYSNGAVRFEYLPIHILRYQYFEYDSPPVDIFDQNEHIRFQNVWNKEQEVIQEVLRPLPDLLIYEHGNFSNPDFQTYFESAERVSIYIDKFEDVVRESHGVLQTIHVIDVRKEF